jgi:hypothetical protein
LYEATENELKFFWDDDFKKCEKGPRSHLFQNNRLPSDFNVEVEGVAVNVIKYFESQIQDHKIKFLMVSFEVFNLLIQESYDVKRVEHYL